MIHAKWALSCYSAAKTELLVRKLLAINIFTTISEPIYVLFSSKVVWINKQIHKLHRAWLHFNTSGIASNGRISNTPSVYFHSCPFPSYFGDALHKWSGSGREIVDFRSGFSSHSLQRVSSSTGCQHAVSQPNHTPATLPLACSCFLQGHPKKRQWHECCVFSADLKTSPGDVVLTEQSLTYKAIMLQCSCHKSSSIRSNAAYGFLQVQLQYKNVHYAFSSIVQFICFLPFYSL